MFKIRVMTIADYEDVYSVWISSKGMDLNNLDDSKIGIVRFIKRNPTTCFVATVENKIIGSVISGNDGRRGYIYHTAVLEKYRNMGVATALLNSSLNALKNENINKVALVVFVENSMDNEFLEIKRIQR